MRAHPQFLLAVLAVVLIASLIEASILSRGRGFDWRAAAVSAGDLLGRRMLVLAGISTSGAILDAVWQHRVATVRLGDTATVLLLFVGQDFCYYWYHRASHRIRWFWLTHSVHHSPNELTLSAAYRIGWLQHLTGATAFFAPLVWLGFAPPGVIFALALNLLYQFWLHATWIPRLGWLEYVLNTPSAHRVHHAANVEYLDANYGGVLIIFDRLFGTYVAERSDLPCRYGLVRPQTSHNILRVEFEPWIALLRDLLRARGLWEVLGLLLAPPGWRADGDGETTENLRRRHAHADPSVA
jgi:sterol desaturase/sphingolipid hydroxylase (fatty acid hydroxylase superfamily)